MSDFLWNKSLAWISVFIFNCTDFLSQISVCNHREPLVPKIGKKPLKNHCCQWLIRPKTINGYGEKFSKPSPFHRWRKKNHHHSITMKNWPLLQSNLSYKRWRSTYIGRMWRKLYSGLMTLKIIFWFDDTHKCTQCSCRSNHSVLGHTDTLVRGGER